MSSLFSVSILAGRDLVSKDSNGYSDPYCIIEICGSKKEDKKKLFKTKVVNKNLNPQWNQSFQVEVPKGNNLRIVCYDKDLVTKDDFMGEIIIEVNETTNIDQWIDVKSREKKKDRVSGQIHIAVEPLGAGKQAVNSVAPQFDITPDKCSEIVGLDCPYGVTIDEDGSIYVSEAAANRIQVIKPDGTLVRTIGHQEGQSDGQVNIPLGLAYYKGILYVLDHNRLQAFSKNGEFKFKFGVQGAAAGKFDHPHSVAVDSENRIIITDTHNDRVQIFSKDGKFIKQFGVRGTAQGNLIRPTGLAVDSKDRIIVGENGNKRVSVFNRDGSFQFSIGPFEGNSGEDINVAVDGFDRIIVSSMEHHNLQFYESDGTQITLFGSLGDDKGQFSSPAGLAVDKKTGTVYVANFWSSAGVMNKGSRVTIVPTA